MERLEVQVKPLALHLHVIPRITSEKPGGPAISLPMHEAVCAAIERGDADAAERAPVVLIDQADADRFDRLQGRKSAVLPEASAPVASSAA